MDFLNSLAKTFYPKMYDRSQQRTDLDRFKADPTFNADPSQYADPEEGIKLNERLNGLRDFTSKQDAAPFLAKINDLRADPRFQDAASLEEINKNPSEAVFGQDAPQVSGFSVAGKGKPLVTSAGSNPYIAEALQKFGGGVQNTLDAFRTNGNNMPLARINQDKELSNSFKDSTQGAENVQKVNDLLQKPLDELAAKKNLSDFSSSVGMLNTPSERTGAFMPYGEAAQLIQQAAADYPVKPETVNAAIDNLRGQYKDTWSPPQVRKVGRTSYTYQKNLLGEEKKDAQSTPQNINVNTGGKDKSPVMYLIEKPDGRTVQVDASTLKGRARLESATANGERISKLGTESVSNTQIAPDGSTTTKRISGPNTASPAITATSTQTATPETSVSKSGKPMVKVNGVWEYQ